MWINLLELVESHVEESVYYPVYKPVDKMYRFINT
ncbi:MAG: hypothetical protein ACJA0H_000200 [Francisellaceae bacterium]|jgi:hypothetical protein